ncbi:MAG: phosphorylase kinase [Desulfomonile tiedjei]|uniref:Phosphorylase kinase n=1 Tax=Desulfomonile tiedjei TaxID=2358 RepID=A0A9D6V5Z0_9BACT|nr:phosphorylase kinase [Desulfomonile tiedjei]
MPIVNSRVVAGMVKERYSLHEIRDIFEFLCQKGTFSFHSLPNGLFPAADLRVDAKYTGYGNVWVRDNIYVAFAHHVNCKTPVAVRNVKTLSRYFMKHKRRLEMIVSGERNYREPANRPHIRFDGENLSEINQKWAHAENDALGYFVWLFSRLHNEGCAVITSEERELLALFALYFNAIRYWEDEDSGHWEETRKIESSSIGVVVGALEEFKILLEKDGIGRVNYREKEISIDLLESLIGQGRKSLQETLPAECSQDDPRKNRRYDAALLFLIFPMKVVTEQMADQILFDVTHHLQGDYGIRRYIGDSFWSADYKKKMKPEERTIDVSDNISVRDSLLKAGQEAQWCLFDPIISIIHGLKYQHYRTEENLRLQTYFFNRSLGQLTGEDGPFKALRCPELYYFEDGKYVPNDTVPLLWTQANLWMAFEFMEVSLRKK